MLVKLTSLKLIDWGVPLGAANIKACIIVRLYNYNLPEVEVLAVIVAVVDSAVYMALTVMV